jgi:uncharacterized protein
VRKALALACHLAVLLAVARGSHSAGGFLLTGLGLAALLDRYVLRVFPWPGPVRWRRELAVRAASFLGGAAAFYLVRPGIVPLWEAAYRGAMVTLAVALTEALFGWGTPARAACPSRLQTVGRVCLRLLPPGLFLLSLPYLAAIHPLHTVPKRDPSAFGLSFEDVRFETSDGVRLAGWLMPHPAARGNVLFCHGHGRNRGHVAGLLPTLHGLGLNVLAFDFRGHGDSDGHTSTFGHREVRDVLAAVAYLRQRFPGRPLLIVGVSLGAAVSLQALPELPDVQGVWSEGCFGRLADVVEHYFAGLPAGLRGPLVGLYAALSRLDAGFRVGNVNPAEGLGRVTVPVYFCHGRADELVPWEQGVALHDAYAGPKEHWWVDGASHYNVRQRNSAEYLRRLRGFVEARLAENAGSW